MPVRLPQPPEALLATKSNGKIVKRDIATLRQQFQDDGVVKLESLLNTQDLAAARKCYAWSLSNLGPHGKGAGWLGPGAETFEDKANPAAPAVYESFLKASPFAEVAGMIWSNPDIWFMYEQVFKKAGACRRTPWHQDSSYLAVEGDDLIVFWISFAAVPKTEALEFVAGSHRGPLYNGSTFNTDDPTEPFYSDSTLPRLPHIDRSPNDWKIVSWATEPGDVIAFHPKILHGGGATTNTMRETVSLRFFGNDAVYATRPGPCGPRIAGLHERLNDGEPFRHPSFLQLR
jgi:hypothetical protein